MDNKIKKDDRRTRKVDFYAKENGELFNVTINARTPVNARKMARLQLTKNDKIIAVKRK